MTQKIVSATGFDDIRLEERELDNPDNSTKLFKTQFSMISTGTELHTVNQIAKSNVKRYLGYIAVGSIDDTGDAYFLFPSRTNGGPCHCDMRYVPDDWICINLDEGIDPRAGCFLRFINIAVCTMNNLKYEAEKVAVFGMGLVGNTAAQVAQLSGYEVTAVDISSNRLEIAKECGIGTVAEFSEIEKEQNQFDFIIDTVAGNATIQASINLLKPSSESSLVGIVKPMDMNAFAFLSLCWQKDLVFRSGWELNHPLFPKHKNPGQVSIYENLEKGMQWLKDGRFQFEPMVTKTIQPVESDIQKAYQDLSSHPDEYVGVMIDWRDSAALTEPGD